MKDHELTTYTRLAPAVLALQVLPGVEDNWVAIDQLGRELSRASTLEAVQRAAPGADCHPILDLPGLHGKPLTMGDYAIDDGDGVYYMMAKSTFEELFTAGEPTDAGKAPHRKAAPETRTYRDSTVNIDELLAELTARDAELENVKQEFALVMEAKPDEPAALEEPVYVQVFDISDLSDDEIQTRIGYRVSLSLAEGRGYHRATMNEAGDRLLIEGWATQPADQGEPRWPANLSSAGTPVPALTELPGASEPQTDNSGHGGSQDQNSDSSSTSTDGTQTSSESTSSADGQSSSQEPAKTDPLDHDGDGKKGGSKPRAKKTAGTTTTAG